jgi:TonB family protein
MGLRRHYRGAHHWQPAAIAVLLVCMVLTWCAPARAQQTAGQYQVEAAYLYNFTKAARWSEQSLPDRAGLIIGVLGGDEGFIQVLRDVLAHKVINGHILEVRQLRSGEEVKFCHVVFFRTSEPATRAVIAQFRKSNILLVGENNEFLNDGGMINLKLVDGKVTYDVNTAALERANMRYRETSEVMAKNSAQIPEVQPERSRLISSRVPPEYPRLAMSLNLTGAVQLQAVVRADGTVKQVKVIGGHPVLAEAAAAALMKWRFEAGAKETTESVKINFGE